MAAGVRIEDLLAGEDLATLDGLGPVDVLAGVPALNQARSVAQVAGAVAAGLAKGSPSARAALLVADAGSQDGTPEAVSAWREAAAPAQPVHSVRLAGRPHRGRATLAILAAARRLGARGCVLVEADTALDPEGVERLLEPVLGGEADYVSPAYSRSATEGTLTSNLLAPLARALYGKRLQQLLGGCAALSRRLLDRLLAADAQDLEALPHGVDLWMAVEALAGDHRVVETHLGRKRAHAGIAQPDLATTLAGVVGPFFHLMERYREAWSEVRGSRAVPRRDEPPEPLADTGEFHVERMVRAFRLGLKDLLPVWEQIVPEETLAQLYPLGVLAPDEFRFPSAAWARVVYDFAVAHRQRRLPRDHLLRALTPLYLGRVAAFLAEAQSGPAGRLPGNLEAIGQAFEAQKDYLLARWR